MRTLEGMSQGTPPSRHSSNLSSVRVDEVPVKLPPASVEINLRGLKPTLTLPNVSADPEETDAEESEVSIEELFGGSDVCANG